MSVVLQSFNSMFLSIPVRDLAVFIEFTVSPEIMGFVITLPFTELLFNSSLSSLSLTDQGTHCLTEVNASLDSHGSDTSLSLVIFSFNRHLILVFV